MNIAVGFSTSTAWYSRVIRWATGAKCSHAFLLVNLMGVPMVFEEGVFGYSTRTLENMRKDGSQVVALIPPVVPIDDAFRESFKWLGQRYDYAGLVGMAWVMLSRAFRHKVKNPLASSHAMFCSEEVTRVLQSAKYPGADALDARSTDPETLRKFLMASWGRDA